MGIGIGIDAGGTYTDVVIYAPDQRKVLAASKALTTRDDLSVGIGNALDILDVELLRQAESISLSTTLATNACVEDKGGNGKLIFIGVDPNVIDWVGREYGLPQQEEILFFTKDYVTNNDQFFENNAPWLTASEGIAVVDIDAGSNRAELEKKVRENIEQVSDKRVICGHELFQELNCVRRGASTLLNVRLIPIIGEFLQAIRCAMSQRGISAPVSIVRSDGTLMSESFTRMRPVETLLCGPAAGLIGGANLTGDANCLIIDMGGTTTDVSLIKDNRPVTAKNGISIGKWRTYAKGAFVDTFGLGGDSTVRVDRHRNLLLESHRSIPLCMAAEQWPEIIDVLRWLAIKEKGHSRPLHEFFVLARKMENPDRYSEEEHRFCAALKERARSITETAEMWNTDIYNLKTDRLEREGIIMRCGLTPTDFMQLRGDFTGHNVQASQLAATFMASSCRMSIPELGEKVYDMVKEKMYRNIIRVLLQIQYPENFLGGIAPEMEHMIGEGWKAAKNGGDGFLRVPFQTSATLVGIGAPIHLFLPDVAAALGTTWQIPENAGVANAIGAAIGQVQTSFTVDVRPVKLDIDEGGEGFRVFGPYDTYFNANLEDALANAAEQASRAACEEARRRGLQGELKVDSNIQHKESRTRYGSRVYLGSKVEAVVHPGVSG